MHEYLFTWRHTSKNIGHPYSLNQSHNKADVITNTQEYPRYL